MTYEDNLHWNVQLDPGTLEFCNLSRLYVGIVTNLILCSEICCELLVILVSIILVFLINR